MKPIKLQFGERVIAVVPEYVSGPGWANRPLWVYISRNDGTLRQECVQPEDQTAEMCSLFKPGAAMCEALVSSIPTVKAKKPANLGKLP